MSILTSGEDLDLLVTRAEGLQINIITIDRTQAGGISESVTNLRRGCHATQPEDSKINDLGPIIGHKINIVLCIHKV
jgi:hypothetical protein